MARQRTPRAAKAENTSSAIGSVRVAVVHVKLPTAKDLPLLYTNGIVVNFVGSEFLLTPFTLYQDVWSTPDELTKRLERGEAKPLGRFAMSSQQWVNTVQSFVQQLDSLRAEGVPIPEPLGDLE
jgi:hypothetical protein